jgi:hypothetical protein
MRSFPWSLFPCFALVVLAQLPAQQEVCLSVHGGPAAGLIFNGVGGVVSTHLRAKVGGQYVPYYLNGAETAAMASAGHEAAFQAAGFTTVRVSPNEFCITAAPNGAALMADASYGTDDPELDLDCNLPPNEPISLPETKTNGVLVALPQDGAPPSSAGGTIAIELVSMSLSGPTHWSLLLVADPSLPREGQRQGMHAQLAAQGFHGNRVSIENPLQPSQLIEALQIERTTAGDPVFSIYAQFDAGARQLTPVVIGAGVSPVFGASEYGVATQGVAPGMPWSRVDGTPRVGGTFTIVHEMQLPSAITVNTLALGSAGLPLFNGHLLVDPSTTVFELGLTDPLGAFQRPWLIPPVPSLTGFELCSQAVTLDASYQFAFSTGMRVVLRP